MIPFNKSYFAMKLEELENAKGQLLSIKILP